MDNRDEVIGEHAVDRVFEAAQMQPRWSSPFPEEVYRTVGIPRMRVFKRILFSHRLFSALFHLSLTSVAECFGPRTTAIKRHVLYSKKLDPRWKRALAELAEFDPRSDGESNRLAMWILKTSRELPSVHYLADKLRGIYAMFRSQDLGVVRQMKDEVSFASLWRLQRTDTTRVITPEVKSIVDKAAQQAADARSYRSHAVRRNRGDETLKERDFVAVEWRSEVVLPGRCHVTQAADPDFDEWITIGADHYWNVGFWVGPLDKPEATATRQSLNEFLRVDKVVSVLRGFPCLEAGTYISPDAASYVVLTYRIDPSNHPSELAMWMDESRNRQLDVTVWIECSTGFPTKISFVAGDSEWEQVFIGFDEALEINAPQVAAA